MVVTEKVANVYAEAVLELAREGSALQEMEQELAGVSAALYQDKTVWKFFTSPLLDVAYKIKVLEKTVKPHVSELTFHFLGVLTRRRRLEYLPEIAVAYGILLDRELKRSRVKVQSAQEMKSEQMEGLKEALGKLFHKEIILQMETNPALIGGMVIQSGDILIDTSVKSSLNVLKKTLLSKKILGKEYYEN